MLAPHGAIDDHGATFGVLNFKTPQGQGALLMNALRILLAMSLLSLAGRTATAASLTYVGAAERSGTSQAAVVEGYALAHTGQMLPLDKQGTLIGEEIPSAQLPQVLFNLETALVAAGSDIQHLVKLNVYVDNPRTAAEVRKLFGSRFHGPAHPAVSYVCTPLTHPKAQVALDAVAVVPGDGPTTVLRKRCETILGDARQSDVAILPRGDVVYVSGIAEKGDLAEAVAKDLKGLLATIAHLGLDRSQVVQVKAFLKSMREADVVKQQLAEAFPGGPAPPLVLVEWISDLPVEIEMIEIGRAHV
jgi:enamine deaminase RidA (YjgF/YER057c/UK114 family)